VSPARLAQTGADWTDGCIAVTNPEMQEIFALVRDGTAVEIRP
jgi:L,D-peptidoglycan transpeptidase YkuD (ErfK/YbiS/YcfS/YnhG family)